MRGIYYINDVLFWIYINELGINHNTHAKSTGWKLLLIIKDHNLETNGNFDLTPFYEKRQPQTVSQNRSHKVKSIIKLSLLFSHAAFAVVLL